MFAVRWTEDGLQCEAGFYDEATACACACNLRHLGLDAVVEAPNAQGGTCPCNPPPAPACSPTPAA